MKSAGNLAMFAILKGYVRKSRSLPYYLLVNELLERKVTLRVWRAVTSAFLINGFIVGSFVTRIPDFKESLKLSNSALGTALFCVALGVVGVLSIAGRATAKYGSSKVVFETTILAAITLPLVGYSPNFLVFCASLFLYGAFLAAQDVAMNTHAITLEHLSRNRYMSKFHGFFSLGALIGGFVGGLFAEAKISPFSQGLLICAGVLIVTFIFKSSWLPASADQIERQQGKRKRRPGIIWLIGLLGLCAAIGEGAAADWGAILARDTFNASPFISTIPYLAFSITMVLGRFSGDYLAHKFGTKSLITGGGFIAGIGVLSGLLVGGIGGIIFGWLALGVGLSIVIPMLFSEAGSIAKNKFDGQYSSAEAVATVSGIAYFGFLVGPPTLGFLGDLIGLRWAMMVPAILAISMVVAARPVLRNK
jgi:MFS family permease